MSYIRIRKHYLHLPYVYLGGLEFVALYHVPNVVGFAYGVGPEEANSTFASLIFAVTLSLSSLAMGVYYALVREGFPNMVLRSVVSYCLLGGLAHSLFQVLAPSFVLASGQLFWSVVLALIVIILIRYVFSRIVDASQMRRRVLVLGVGEQAAALCEIVAKEQAGLGVEIIGCIPAGQEEPVENTHAPVLDAPEDIKQFIKDKAVSEVVIALDERRSSRGTKLPLSELLEAKLSGVLVTDVLGFYERELSKVLVNILRPSWMLFSDGFGHSKSRNIMKRAFDLLLGLTLLVIFGPVMVIVAILVFLETGSPILYSQYRMGLDGKEFKIFKFRSMSKDAEKDGKAVWAKKNDTRVTRVGAFIRNTRLDELPQLYNVINGTMSFVGPRPERPQFVEELSEKIPYYDLRHKVKPGLMGWAQLKYPYGASVEDAKNKLEYDLYYTKNHSFFMDVLIVIQTVEVVLLGKGVH